MQRRHRVTCLPLRSPSACCPRSTVPQAVQLSGVADIRLALNLSLRHEVLVQKCCGRRICGHCGCNYNIADIRLPASDGRPEIVMPPLSPPPECAPHLEVREDDTEEVVLRRLQVRQAPAPGGACAVLCTQRALRCSAQRRRRACAESHARSNAAAHQARTQLTALSNQPHARAFAHANDRRSTMPARRLLRTITAQPACCLTLRSLAASRRHCRASCMRWRRTSLPRAAPRPSTAARWLQRCLADAGGRLMRRCRDDAERL